MHAHTQKICLLSFRGICFLHVTNSSSKKNNHYSSLCGQVNVFNCAFFSSTIRIRARVVRHGRLLNTSFVPNRGLKRPCCQETEPSAASQAQNGYGCFQWDSLPLLLQEDCVTCLSAAMFAATSSFLFICHSYLMHFIALLGIS